jgi:7,8-dihydropterin-6-yl-methyl-4-(beta-D-ribofuranosyl)aminobenzene 5'-phosphate synthase
MKFTTPLENTKEENATLINKHGLSLYIETEGLKILFDIGPDDSFLHNVGELGIDLAGVDILVISHAHYDHGGGLEDGGVGPDSFKVLHGVLGDRLGVLSTGKTVDY